MLGALSWRGIQFEHVFPTGLKPRLSRLHKRRPSFPIIFETSPATREVLPLKQMRVGDRKGTRP